METTKIKKVLSDILATTVGAESDDIDEETDLGPEGLDISSLQFFEIVERISMELDAEISDEELEEFHPDGENEHVTFGELVAFVESKVDSDTA